MDLFFALCFVIGLAACTGLRAFLPLFCLGLAVRLQFPLSGLGTSQEALFLASDFTLIILGFLSLAEICCDMVPVLDHTLQVPYFGLRPLAGIYAAMAVLDVDSSWFWAVLFISILLGALVSLPVHTTSTTIRVISTGATAGTLNPVLSVKETMLALLGVAGLMILAPVALVLMATGCFLVVRWVHQRLSAKKVVAAVNPAQWS